MIYTITLNPAVDKTITLKDFSVNHVNRADDVREDAGGKGINVSKMIRNLKGESIALGICAGSSGAFILNQMDEMGLDHLFVRGKGETRTNIKIVDELNKTFTDINEPGRPVAEDSLKSLEDLLFSKITGGDFLVLAGSVPTNVSKDIYRSWIERANQKGAKVILDADRELLEQGILAGPYLIKPNMDELEALFHQKIGNIEEGITLAKGLLKYGIQIIVISRGKDGSVVVTPDKTWMLNGLTVPVKSTVGAGDSMVAALAFALHKGDSLEEAMTLGVAASSASIMQEGTIMGSLEAINDLKQHVTITTGQ